MCRWVFGNICCRHLISYTRKWSNRRYCSPLYTVPSSHEKFRIRHWLFVELSLIQLLFSRRGSGGGNCALQCFSVSRNLVFGVGGITRCVTNCPNLHPSAIQTAVCDTSSIRYNVKWAVVMIISNSRHPGFFRRCTFWSVHLYVDRPTHFFWRSDCFLTLTRESAYPPFLISVTSICMCNPQ